MVTLWRRVAWRPRTRVEMQQHSPAAISAAEICAIFRNALTRDPPPGGIAFGGWVRPAAWCRASSPVHLTIHAAWVYRLVLRALGISVAESCHAFLELGPFRSRVLDCRVRYVLG